MGEVLSSEYQSVVPVAVTPPAASALRVHEAMTSRAIAAEVPQLPPAGSGTIPAATRRSTLTACTSVSTHTSRGPGTVSPANLTSGYTWRSQTSVSTTAPR